MVQRNEPSYRVLAAICGLSFAGWSGAVALATSLALNRITVIEERVDEGILPRADERIRNLEARLDRLEEELMDHEQNGH